MQLIIQEAYKKPNDGKGLHHKVAISFLFFFCSIASPVFQHVGFVTLQ